MKNSTEKRRLFAASKISFGIRERLIVFSLFLSIPLVLVGAVTLWGLWQESQEKLRGTVEEQAQLAAIVFERWIDDQQKPLTTLSLETAEEANGINEFTKSLPFILETHSDWIDLHLLEQGKITKISQQQSEKPLPDFDSQALSFETKRRGTWAVMAEQMSAIERQILLLGVPVQGDKTLIVRINGNAIRDIFSDIKLSPGVIITIFGSNGNIIYRSSNPEESMPDAAKFSGILANLKDRRTASVEAVSPVDGVQKIYGMAHAGDTDCVVMINIPTATLREPAQKQFTRYATLSIFALGAAILAAIFLAGRIVTPIQNLMAVTQSFGAGNRKIRAPFHSKDEIGELGATFNQMADQIAEREEKLTELDRLKSEFVSSVSHELRTPLTTIKTLTRILLRGNSTEAERQEYLETIAVECDRQIDLVLNLLNLSRIESGETHLEIKAVEIADVFQACERLEKHAAEAHGQNLIVIKPAKTLLAQADRSALRRVLCILIENAVKFSPEGGRIILESEKSANEEVIITVADNGCGIAEKDLPFIFDKFYQGTIEENEFDLPTEKAEASGVGLGLYLARTLVEKMNGSLTVKSAVGAGSVFTITLPTWRETVGAEKQLERKNEQAVIGG